jgi:hypothetical protein
MQNQNKFLVRMDLSSMPKDIIPYISKHLIDCSVLDMCVKYPRKKAYLLYFFFGQNLPKDAEKYNKNKYYKTHDFTQYYKENISGVLGMIKQKYKQLHLRNYEITFSSIQKNTVPNHHEPLISFRLSIYNNKNQECLKLNDIGITRITHHEDHNTCLLLPYKDLKFSDMEENIFINTLNNILNDIKYYVKQCYTYEQLKYYIKPCYTY